MCTTAQYVQIHDHCQADVQRGGRCGDEGGAEGRPSGYACVRAWSKLERGRPIYRKNYAAVYIRTTKRPSHSTEGGCEVPTDQVCLALDPPFATLNSAAGRELRDLVEETRSEMWQGSMVN